MTEAYQEQLRKLHVHLFPEEYDFILDSHADAAERSIGINPMNVEYQNEVNERRKILGVQPLNPDGTAPVDSGSWEFTKRKALLS